MRRSILLTLLALGGVLTAIGGTGLFAALSDTTRTGTNSVSSKALASSADLQLATAANTFPAVCGPFSENLASGFFSIVNAQASDVLTGGQYFCLKNLGSQTVTVSGLIEERADVDTACTGDEAQSGDATCGGNLLGELSGALDVRFATVNCGTGALTYVVPVGTKLSSLTTAVALGTLPPNGGVGCFFANVHYPSDTPAATTQKAQSDQVTWRYAFTGQV